MRLYDEIFKNADGGALSRCIVGGYFEGVKAVEDFSSEKIILCFLKERVELLGDGLTIKKYCDGDLQLAGKILSLRVLVGEE